MIGIHPAIFCFIGYCIFVYSAIFFGESPRMEPVRTWIRTRIQRPVAISFTRGTTLVLSSISDSFQYIHEYGSGLFVRLCIARVSSPTKEILEREILWVEDRIFRRYEEDDESDYQSACMQGAEIRSIVLKEDEKNLVRKHEITNGDGHSPYWVTSDDDGYLSFGISLSPTSLTTRQKKR
jgi:hypothetical protein